MGRLKKFIGARIKEIRCKRGLTQEQLSVKANIGLSTICRLENGLNMPREENLEALSEALGVSVDTFFKFSQYEGDRNTKIMKIFNNLHKLSDEEVVVVYKFVKSLAD